MVQDKKSDIKPENVEVVIELPTTQVSKAVDETGNEIRLITLTQAITEIYKDIKDIRNKIG